MSLLYDFSGRQLGNYRLISLIGEGGMGAVYRAKQINLEREVAVKVLPQATADKPQFAARFEREARTIAKLDQHPHIVSIIDYGTEMGISYVVMPLLTGGSLRKRMQAQGTFPVANVVDFLHELGSALDFAHGQGIVHRDIKPDNVMFDEFGNPLLVDFGIAKIVAGEGTQLTASGMMIGTPMYMAPEQWNTSEVDGSTDQYSMAVVVYEMLAGVTPFQADTPQQLMFKHINASPTPLDVYRKDLPPRVATVLARALAKQPAERFQSMEAFSRALDAAAQLTGGTVARRRPAALQTLGRHSGRRWPVLAGGGLIVLLLAVLATLFSGVLGDDSDDSGADSGRGGALTAIAANNASPTPARLSPQELIAQTDAVQTATAAAGSLTATSGVEEFLPATLDAMRTETSVALLPQAMPTNTARHTATDTRTPLPTVKGTFTPLPSPTSIDLPSATPTRTDTPLPSPTNTPLPTATPTATVTEPPVPTVTLSPTLLPISTATHAPTQVSADPVLTYADLVAIMRSFYRVEGGQFILTDVSASPPLYAQRLDTLRTAESSVDENGRPLQNPLDFWRPNETVVVTGRMLVGSTVWYEVDLSTRFEEPLLIFFESEQVMPPQTNRLLIYDSPGSALLPVGEPLPAEAGRPILGYAASAETGERWHMIDNNLQPGWVLLTNTAGIDYAQLPQLVLDGQPSVAVAQGEPIATPSYTPPPFATATPQPTTIAEDTLDLPQNLDCRQGESFSNYIAENTVSYPDALGMPFEDGRVYTLVLPIGTQIYADIRPADTASSLRTALASTPLDVLPAPLEVRVLEAAAPSFDSATELGRWQTVYRLADAEGNTFVAGVEEQTYTSRIDLNVRAAPRVDGEVLGQLVASATTVDIVASTWGPGPNETIVFWYYVKARVTDLEGWVASGYDGESYAIRIIDRQRSDEPIDERVIPRAMLLPEPLELGAQWNAQIGTRVWAACGVRQLGLNEDNTEQLSYLLPHLDTLTDIPATGRRSAVLGRSWGEYCLEPAPDCSSGTFRALENAPVLFVILGAAVLEETRELWYYVSLLDEDFQVWVRATDVVPSVPADTDFLEYVDLPALAAQQ